MSDKIKELYKKLYNEIDTFGKVCFPSAITAAVPSFHKDIYKYLRDDAMKRVLIASYRGSSKRLALDAKILTPNGWVENKDLSVGDYVIGSNGKPTMVVNISDTVNRPLYRLKTRDGRSVLCDSEHLWQVGKLSGGPYYKDKRMVMTTQELIDFPYNKPRYDKRYDKHNDDCMFAIDTPDPIQFEHKELPIDPYDLGVILGDGSIHLETGFTMVHSCKDDVEDLLSNMSWGSIGDVKYNKEGNGVRFSLLGIGKHIRELKLLGNVYSKHIPKEYLFSSIEQRLALLQGLMDTDGCNGGESRPGASFTTVSTQLADDFVHLVRSLGGIATVGKYSNNLSTCTANIIHISLPDGMIPFRLKRKIDRFRPARRKRNAIVSIEYEKDDYGRCIMVDAEDHLFVTEDFLITHNSTLCSLVYPLWKVAFKKPNEDLFIIIVSEAQAQSINFLNRIKYHLDRSDNFKLLFGDMSSVTAKRWTQNDIILANGARIMALGTGQKIRGAIEGDTRPNVIILDDIESETNAATAETRVDNRKWITDAVIPSLADNGRIIMVGTVIHEDCFLCWAKESPAWNVLWYGIVDENDEPTWPERFPMERVRQIKEEFASVGNLNGFYQEYMNIAQAPDTAPFKPTFIRIHDYIYDVREDKQVLYKNIGSEEIVIPVNVYMGIDPASSLSKTADYFVIAVVAVDADDNAYLIDLIRERMSPELQPQAIIDMYKRYRPMKTTIEVVGYQEALRTSVRSLMTSQGLFIPGIESGIRPRTSKNERLISLVPRFASGRFYFRSQDIAAQQEFLSYPSGKHNDAMDAIFYAIDKSFPCRHRSVKKKTVDKIKSKLSWLTV